MKTKQLLNKIINQYEVWKQTRLEQDDFKLIQAFNELAKSAHETQDIESLREAHKHMCIELVGLVRNTDMEKYTLWESEQKQEKEVMTTI
tara:strand:- start:760 stop:1029 length:270 start_codon:yes stop_codon:yes gene_type:complete